MAVLCKTVSKCIKIETSKVQYSLVPYVTMWYDLEQCSPLRYSVIYCGTVAQYSLWRCSVLQCGTDRCWTPLVLSGTQHHMLLHFVIQVSQCNVQSHALLYITAHHRMVLCATMQSCVQPCNPVCTATWYILHHVLLLATAHYTWPYVSSCRCLL